MHAARSGATLFVTVIGVTLYSVRRSVGAGASADPGDVLLADVGDGFTLTGEAPNTTGLESLTRQFETDNAILQLTVIPVTTPPGVRDVFGLFSAAVPEPALDLAGWLVSPGAQVGDDGDARLVFASRDHVFIFDMLSDEDAGIDAPAFLRDLAQRQVEAAVGRRRRSTRRAIAVVTTSSCRCCPANHPPSTGSPPRRRPPATTS